MEQARLWMWEKPSHSLINGSSTTHVQASMNSSSYDGSWEEQAFAEDAAGPLGGCIWPPRSYTCSFCRREFRSAQALGGHMNIHRRDRARLKQSANFQNEIQHRKDIQTHSGTCDSQDVLEYPPQVRTLLDNPNPSALNFGGVASSSSASRVSISPSNQESIFGKKRMLPITSNVQLQYTTTPFSSPLYFVHGRGTSRYFDSDAEGESSSRIVDLDQIERRSSSCKFAKPDLSVRLNLIVRRTNQSGPSGSDKEETISCKRIRIDSSNLQSSLDDLDLELRLGKRPKVK